MASDQFGWAVGTAGDVNGDGCSDLLVGAWRHSSYRGKIYLYHGCSPSGLGSFPAFTDEGENEGDYFGWAVSSAGDVNGDGYGDLVAGAWGL